MINLLPEEIKRKRKREKYWRVIFLIFILFLGVLFGSVIYSQVFLIKEQESFSKKKEEIEALKSVVNEIKKIRVEKLGLDRREELINKVDSNLSYSKIVSDLNIIMLKEVWLKEFRMDDKGFIIKVRSLNNRQVFQSITRLEKYPYFHRIKLIKSDKGDKIINFNLQGGLKL